MRLHCFKVLRIVENKYHQISRKNAAEMYALWTVAKYSAKLFSMAFDVGISRAPSLTAPNHPHHTSPPKNDRFEIVSTLYTYMQETHASCRRLYEWNIIPQTNGSCESACTLLLLLSSSSRRVFMLAAPQHTAAIITRPKLGYNMWVIARARAACIARLVPGSIVIENSKQRSIIIIRHIVSREWHTPFGINTSFIIVVYQILWTPCGIAPVSFSFIYVYPSSLAQWCSVCKSRLL